MSKLEGTLSTSSNVRDGYYMPDKYLFIQSVAPTCEEKVPFYLQFRITRINLNMISRKFVAERKFETCDDAD